MDAFFAAVEVLDDPSLAGKPVIVGGDGRRGVVASCTYEARVYGVHSAMSSVEARRRCPDALFVGGRYWRYSEVSEELHEVFRSFTPLVEPIGLDEAFLDVAGTRHAGADPVAIAHAVRAAVRERTGLRCSVGVARTKLLAKLASEAAKPVAGPTGPRPGRGVVVVLPPDEIAFLHPLPMRALWGVGPATAARLAGLGIETVGDLAAIPEETLVRTVGDAHGRHLAALSRGEDERAVEPDRATKSVGHEETFADDLHSHEALHGHAVRMADAVAARMQDASLVARTITVKIRFGDRTTITRSHSVGTPTASPRVLRAVALTLLEAVDVGPGVRLLGVSGSNLADAGDVVQLSFDDVGAATDDTGAAAADERTWSEVEEVVAAIRARFGADAVAPAALAVGGRLSVKRRGDTQWGPSDARDQG